MGAFGSPEMAPIVVPARGLCNTFGAARRGHDSREKTMIKTVIVKSERLVIRRPGRTASALCGECAGGLLTLEEAVAVAGVTSRAIHRWVEAEALHFAETPEGLLLVCLNSLAARAGLAESDAGRRAIAEGEAGGEAAGS